MTIDVHIPPKFLQYEICLLLNEPLQNNGNSKNSRSTLGASVELTLSPSNCCMWRNTGLASYVRVPRPGIVAGAGVALMLLFHWGVPKGSVWVSSGGFENEIANFLSVFGG